MPIGLNDFQITDVDPDGVDIGLLGGPLSPPSDTDAEGDDNDGDDEEDGPETNSEGYVTEGKTTFTLGDETPDW